MLMIDNSKMHNGCACYSYIGQAEESPIETLMATKGALGLWHACCGNWSVCQGLRCSRSVLIPI